MDAQLQVLQQRRQVGEAAEAVRPDGAPESLKGAVDPVIVGLANERGRGVLADVCQHDATVLSDDGFPGVVVTFDDGPLEDLEAEGILARLAAQKPQGLLATAPRQLANQQLTQAHPFR